MLLLIIAWHISSIGSQEPHSMPTSSQKPYTLFVVENTPSGPDNLHAFEKMPTATVSEFKADVAKIIKKPTSHFKLVLDHEKGYMDTFEDEPHKTLQSYFAQHQTGWLFAYISQNNCLSISSSSSSSKSKPSEEINHLTQALKQFYFK